MKKNIQITSVLELILNRKYRWLFHFLFLLVVFAEDIDYTFRNDDDKNLTNLLIIAIQIFSIYFNIYYLFKKFLINGKILKYVIYTGLCILTYAFTNYFAYHFEENNYIILNSDNKAVPFSLIDATTLIIFYSFRMLCIIGTAVGIKILKYYYIQQQKIQDLKRDSLENELRYLKNQINPHFLFNSLNNIYTLSKTNSTKSSETILLLSELLRYQLYDCSKEKVLLKDEIEYLKNFIKLEDLRKKNRIIKFTLDGEVNNIKIAPFLFMPFVENAIKFGMLAKDTSIEIKFLISYYEIRFEISNNIPINNQNKTFGGIGLKNVKRRLDLIYPNDYELIINEIENKFQVILILRNEKN